MEDKLKWYQEVALQLFWMLCLLISIMPRCVRYYVLKPLIGVLLILTHYRYKVIIGNLTRSFPQKSTK